ncbi:MAG: D-tyrosyl-tRNA(Tyr) deacylase [Muribaculaceae bacterium]|nr:D-tyrosyl-tRNA(Tyr) deacylase [Muribaculaceae bacterium]
MRLVIQRVTEASVLVDGQTVGSIGKGLMILVGVEDNDSDDDCLWLAAKAANMRIFDDENGVINRSVMDIGGDILAVSQFTLLASTRKGNRPSYVHAAGHELATRLYELFKTEMESLTGRRVASGVFGADMKVSLTNDGPVTIIIDSRLRL